MENNHPKKHVKNYNLWNEKKKIIDKETITPPFKEREIWWCSLGCNIGSEEDGKHEKFERPVIVFLRFTKNIFWAIPLSTQIYPKESHIHYTFECGGVVRVALIHQMRLISSNRLIKYISTISFDNFQIIRKFVRDLA
jgi:mRNA-degrading endonuclease toxin of MazEF toxin-antitoxin module